MNTPQRQKLRANAQEITFLKQAITAQSIREQLELEPSGEWHGLQHNHLCEHCDETWRCECDDGEYLVTQHGCDAQHEATRRLAIALRMPSKYDAPYLSRFPKRKERAARGTSPAAQFAANEMEIAHLKATLGI